MRRNSGGRGSFVLDAGAGALGPVIAGRGRGRGHFPRVRASLFFFFPSQNIADAEISPPVRGYEQYCQLRKLICRSGHLKGI